MFESKYSGFLTALLVIVIIGILGLIGYLGYTYYQKYYLDKDSAEYVDSFIEERTDDSKKDKDENQQGELPDGVGEIDDTPYSSSTSGKVQMYKGYPVIGTIEIPTINLKYPILEKVTKGSIEVAVARMYGVGPNQEGNIVIAGHNYRNGQFFSNNHKLAVGDKVYITDNNKNRVAYTIYDKFEAEPEDTSFYNRATNGAREITLSTCTDDSKARIIIFAKADEDA